MWKICYFLVTVLVLERMLPSDAQPRPSNKRDRKRMKKVRAEDMVNQLSSLQTKVSSLRTDMERMESSRVMVHVHGLGDDPVETNEGQGGTHVHIHMHLDDHHDGDNDIEGDRDHDHHDHHNNSMHRRMKMKMKMHKKDGVNLSDHSHEDHHEDGEGISDHSHEDHHGDGEDNESEGEGKHRNHGHHGCKMGGGMMTKAMKKKMMKMKNMHKHMHFPPESTYIYGHCEMAMNPTQTDSSHNISGAIHFRQKMHGPLEILLHLKGFHVPADAHSDHSMHTHGFHVHEFGDISKGCQSFGGHYNPDGVDHAGKKSKARHAGDWGNIACDDHGEIHSNMTDSHTSLVGTHSIMGRGIVIHEHQDDLGLGGVAASLKTGNAGGRLACCTVAWAAEHDWAMLLKHEHK